MPIYEYQDVVSGRFMEMFRPMRFRDDCPPHLKRVVSKPAVKVGSGTPDPTCADVAAPRALKEMESQMGTSKLEKEMGMSAKKLKEIWNT